MSVYFIACGGFIKVGFSKDPARRFANLFTSASRYSAPRASFEARASRELLRTIAGDKNTERTLHEALEDYYAGCEWFVDEPEVREWIDSLPDDDRHDRSEYRVLIREAGPVEVPRGEMGGGNVELTMSVLAKREGVARSA